MNRQSGITLVEVAVSIAIVGILMAGALEMEQRARTQRQFESTYDNMDTIIQALSIYVETAGRLPCAADPAPLSQQRPVAKQRRLEAHRVEASHVAVRIDTAQVRAAGHALSLDMVAKLTL